MSTTTTCSWSKSLVTASSHSSSSSTPAWRRGAAPLSGPSPVTAIPSVPVSMPSRRSRSSSASSGQSWRTATPSPATSTSPILFQKPGYGVLGLGSILYLPDSVPDKSSIIFGQLLHGAHPFGHPIVVSGKSVEGGVEYVKMRICTTFGGRHIMEARDPRFHDQFVLLENDEDNVAHDGSVLATVEPGSGRFSRRTYISLLTEYKIEYKHLAPWVTTSPVTLDQASIRRLVRGYPVFLWR